MINLYILQITIKEHNSILVKPRLYFIGEEGSVIRHIEDLYSIKLDTNLYAKDKNIEYNLLVNTVTQVK